MNAGWGSPSPRAPTGHPALGTMPWREMKCVLRCVLSRTWSQQPAQPLGNPCGRAGWGTAPEGRWIKLSGCCRLSDLKAALCFGSLNAVGAGPPRTQQAPLLHQKGLISVFLSFFFFRSIPAACRSSQARGESELQPLAYTTATATLGPSLVCDLHHSSWQQRILNLLSEARD